MKLSNIQLALLSLLITSSFQKFPFFKFWKTDAEKEREDLQFFNNNLYFSKLASEKMELLWKEVTKNRTPLDFYGTLKVGSILLHDNSPTFKEKGDVLPIGRDKLIHTQGVIAKIKFKTVPNKYSGVLNSGCTNALLRLSVAKEYDTKKSTPDGAFNNFVPAISFKCLISGKVSSNLVAMFDTMGQSSWNFFKNKFTNAFRINKKPFLPNKLLANNFSEVTEWISSVGIKSFALYNEHGVEASQAKYPFRLEFIPTSQMSQLFSDSFTTDYKNIVVKIPSNTVIYEVFAIDEPGCVGEKIGEFVSMSEFTTSTFADRDLFFSHSDVGEDDNGTDRGIARDSWRNKKYNEGSELRVSEKKCPFGFE